MPRQNVAHPKKGLILYADVLRLIARSPRTNAQITKTLGLPETTPVSRITNAMWALGLIHPKEWRLNCSRYVAVWKSGEGKAPPHPTQGEVKPKPPRILGVITFAHLWQELASPSSMRDLLEVTGLKPHTAYRILTYARAVKLIHVAGYSINHQGGSHTPLYQRGNKPDVERPKACRTEQNKRYWLVRKSRLQHLQMIGATAGAYAAGA